MRLWDRLRSSTSRLGAAPHAPAWSDVNSSDPGITILEAMLFSLLTATYFGTVTMLVRELGRTRRSVTVEEGWSRVDNLAKSGPGDRHYAIDPATGDVKFGDGVHGAMPSTETSTGTRYRYGAGAVGVVGAATVVWAGGLYVWCRRRSRRTP